MYYTNVTFSKAIYKNVLFKIRMKKNVIVNYGLYTLNKIESEMISMH